MCLLVAQLFLPIAAADTAHAPGNTGGPAASLELVCSWEHGLSERNTLLVWGGAGAVAAFFEDDPFAYGLEVTVERRHYFNPGYRGMNISGYGGIAAMAAGDNAKQNGIEEKPV